MINNVCQLWDEAIDVDALDDPRAGWRKHFIQIGENGADAFESALNQTTRVLKGLFEQAGAPYSGVDPTVLASLIHRQNLGADPQPLESVIAQTGEVIGRNSIIVQHPRCIAHLHTPPMLPGIAAESFIAALNPSMDSWDQSGAATYVEQEVIDWLAGQLYSGGGSSDGVFTSGGTQSNLMGLLLARDHLVKTRSGQSVQKDGLPQYAHKLRILCSRNSHFTVKKSAAILGLGEHAVVCVDTYPDGTIQTGSLAETVKDLRACGLIPFAVVGTAGTTDHGAIDDLDALASIAALHDLWLHVDAAYGGALILSRYKSRLKGIELADSVSIDFHKMFFQPISCGAILLKDKDHFGFLRHHVDYLNREDDVLPNLVDKSMSTTRRFDALKVWMTLQNVGADTLGAMVEHLVKQTRQAADLVNNRAGFQLLASPCLSTVLFRYTGTNNSTGLNSSTGLNNSPGTKNDGIDLCSLNKQLRLEALVKGKAVVGETVAEGVVSLKLTLLNPCLELSDFDALLDELETLAKQMS